LISIKTKGDQIMKSKTLFITQAAAIAAIYVALVFIWPASSGVIQVRIAEALTILPYFTPAAIPGVTIGCLIANLNLSIYDIIFGTLATLVGAVGSYMLRKTRYLVPVPPIVANAIIIPFVLRASGVPDAIPFMMLTVGVGEVISCGVLGMVLLIVLERYEGHIFSNIKNREKS